MSTAQNMPAKSRGAWSPREDMHCKDQEKSCFERMDASGPTTAIDVLICDRSITRARLTVDALRRVDSSLSTVRLLDVTQAHRLLFDRGLFTHEPQIPQLLLIEHGMPGREELLHALQTHWRTMWLPVIEVVASGERFRISSAHRRVIDGVDRERYAGSIAVAAREVLRQPIQKPVRNSSPIVLTSSPA